MNDNGMIDKIIDFLCRAKRKTYAGKGKEVIYHGNVKVYECLFHGGKVK